MGSKVIDIYSNLKIRPIQELRGAFKKKKLRNFGHVAKRGGVSSSGKLFNEEKFGHVFRGGGQRDSSKVVFVKKSLY